MRRWLCLTIGFAWCIAGVPDEARADPATQGTAVEPFDGIEVLGQPDVATRVVRKELRKLMAPVPFSYTAPRFFDRVCPKLVGFSPSVSRRIEARIQDIMLDLRLKAAPARCRANALVILVDDPKQLFKRLRSRRLDIVGGEGFRDVPTRVLDTAFDEGRPVVSWNIIGQRSASGATFQDDGLTVASAINASRLTSTVVRDKMLSVVIYDSRKISDFSVEQIADNASMHLFVSPNRNAEFDQASLPTILSLFKDGPDRAPKELTQFDIAYLRGVYSLNANALASQIPAAVVRSFAGQCKQNEESCRMELKK